MEENTTTKTQIKAATLKSLWQDAVITNFSKLRFNKENNYPFLTLFNNEKVNNVYFSQETAKIIENQGFEKGTDLVKIGFLNDAQIAQTENNSGETRFKIFIPSIKEEYTTKASAEAAFGAQKGSEFSVEMFLKEFIVPAKNAVTAH